MFEGHICPGEGAIDVMLQEYARGGYDDLRDRIDGLCFSCVTDALCILIADAHQRAEANRRHTELRDRVGLWGVGDSIIATYDGNTVAFHDGQTGGAQ